ncbi:hypothetical protein M8J77_016013 [Diaphorina citri]|nr:hypothetical protein M8J77_016013 [Diaphorina citri]
MDESTQDFDITLSQMNLEFTKSFNITHNGKSFQHEMDELNETVTENQVHKTISSPVLSRETMLISQLDPFDETFSSVVSNSKDDHFDETTNTMLSKNVNFLPNQNQIDVPRTREHKRTAEQEMECIQRQRGKNATRDKTETSGLLKTLCNEIFLCKDMINSFNSQLNELGLLTKGTKEKETTESYSEYLTPNIIVTNEKSKSYSKEIESALHLVDQKLEKFNTKVTSLETAMKRFDERCEKPNSSKKIQKEEENVIVNVNEVQRKETSNSSHDSDIQVVHLLGDSHITNIKHHLSKNVPTSWNIKENFKSGASFKSTKQRLDNSPSFNVSQNDLTVLMLGSNDACVGIWTNMEHDIEAMINKLDTTKICFVLIPLRYDCPWMNKHIIRLNTKIKYFVRQFQNILVLNPNKDLTDWDYTNHGAHLSRHGKRKLSQRISYVLKNFEKLQRNANNNTDNIREKPREQQEGNRFKTNNKRNPIKQKNNNRQKKNISTKTKPLNTASQNQIEKNGNQSIKENESHPVIPRNKVIDMHPIPSQNAPTTTMPTSFIHWPMYPDVPGHRVESTPPPGPVPIPMQPPPWLSQLHVHPSTQQQIVFRPPLPLPPPPPIPVHSANPFHERWRTNLNPVFTHLENNGHFSGEHSPPNMMDFQTGLTSHQ